MLDQDILEQLESVFQNIQSELVIEYDESTHLDQAQLLELLKDVAGTSPNFSLRSSQKPALAPQFRLFRAGKASGVSFLGIPNGHEFTSLIVALLNADGKGKLPDPLLLERIKKLKGPIEVRTFISLTCENCPEVVQALNLMALVHSDFKHEMVDGAYVPEEIQKLGLQGVPSVVVQGKLIHSGRAQLLDLLNKLEAIYGSNTAVKLVPTDLGTFDVAVIGGGPAGVTAAIYSARKGLRTLLIAEKMGGQVQETKGIENFISVPYTEGPEFSARLVEHLSKYDVKVLEHRRVLPLKRLPGGVSGTKEQKIDLDSGEFFKAHQVIIATGAKWRELGIPGEKTYLGKGVAFCPHCDGPFYKGKDIAVIGGGNSGVEAAIDLAGIVKSIVVLEFQSSLKADQVLVKKLESLPNVRIVLNAKATEVLGDGNKVEVLKYQDTKSKEFTDLPLDGIFVQIGLLPNSQFLKGFLDLTPFGEIIVDAKGRTSQAGIYAAGDVTTTPYKQIIIAMGEGAKVALAAFEDRMFGI